MEHEWLAASQEGTLLFVGWVRILYGAVRQEPQRVEVPNYEGHKTIIGIVFGTCCLCI